MSFRLKPHEQAADYARARREQWAMDSQTGGAAINPRQTTAGQNVYWTYQVAPSVYTSASSIPRTG